MHITNLGGHSGCNINLYETDEHKTFVRKISSDLSYNDRLKVQAEKQSKYTSEKIKTPKVLAVGEDENGLFYFDMEYIQGITLAEYLKTIEIGKIRGLVNCIVENIINISDNEEYDDNVFVNKISSLRKNIKNSNYIIEEAFNILESHSWKKFNKSACHGDLTLENIIIKDNQLFFIDFLDSFYDSWILDISTIMQDVQALWSYRDMNEIDINTLIRLIIFKDILMDRVKELSGGLYVEVYYALLLKLMRIYPYTKDEKTYQFLNEKVKLIIEIIRKEELS